MPVGACWRGISGRSISGSALEHTKERPVARMTRRDYGALTPLREFGLDRRLQVLHVEYVMGLRALLL